MSEEKSQENEIKSENNESNENNESKSNEKNENNVEESIHFSKIIKKEVENNSNLNLMDKENMFASKYFMKSIDLRCEDHVTKFQEDVEATRFCQKCNVICCDSCVIDYHIDHISFAKKKWMIFSFLKKIL